MEFSERMAISRCGQRLWLSAVLLLAAIRVDVNAAPAAQGDPYVWLEEIDSPQALAWVQTQNEATAKRLTARPEYEGLYHDALTILDSESRLPEVEAHGPYLYNLWKDAQHPRGLYRRTTADEFRRASPRWETVLDVDALAQTEHQPWTLAAVTEDTEGTWLREDERHCLIGLAPGGTDASELREFDTETKQFVTDGFRVPVAKSRVAWINRDTLLVATDFGPGSLTTSGYARILKQWHRGTPLADAVTVYEAAPSSVLVAPKHLGEGASAIDLVEEPVTYWETKISLLRNGKTERLQLPPTVTVCDALDGRLIIWLKAEWRRGAQTLPAGAVIAADLSALRSGDGTVAVLFAPSAHVVANAVQVTKAGVYVEILDNVRGRLVRFEPKGALWQEHPIEFPDNGALKIATTSQDTGDAWVAYESFTTPPALYHLPAHSETPQKLKQQEPTFDGSRFTVQQRWCSSADGQRVPYFVVGPKGMKYDGTNPVWMFSYGGFEVALTPSYSGSYEDLHGAYGKLWLERGGVFVLANIRGGGEFGPAWHRTALKANHVKAFEDFEAVARDLVAAKITSPAHLGIEGRSNGGLLVASTMLRHPELYGAVVCGSPLLDMQRYQHLLAGASWMAEYGDPEKPEEWAFLGKYSPYQNVRVGMKLPPILFYTSTRDDRVHPGHARKMAAKMEALGYAVDYYENTEGGHHGSVTSEQLATRLARTYTFLWEHVGRGATAEETAKP